MLLLDLLVITVTIRKYRGQAARAMGAVLLISTDIIRHKSLYIRSVSL